jgi:predicted transposase YdaD
MTMSVGTFTREEAVEAFEKIGLAAARWEARGEERKALEIAENMLSSGFPLETVSAMTKLDPETVKAIIRIK